MFNFAPNAATNKDTITDFAKGVDKLQYSKAVFTELGAVGALDTSQFVAGNFTAGQDTSDRIVYNTSTGVLYYDADGSGADAAVAVALIGVAVHPTLVASDLVIIA